MSFLSEIQTALLPLGLPIETGAYRGKAPDSYLVVVPMTDSFELHADDLPGAEVCEARLSLFTKGAYTGIAKKLVSVLLKSDFIITFRQYNGYETDTGYHHYVVDAAKAYEYELED